MTSDTRHTTPTAITLGGRYRLVDRIAVGGMGEVWAARDLLLDRDVAVKLLKAEYLENPGFLARFRAEARHTANLSHPGIATVYDYGEVNEAPFLVMELVQGEPLSALLHRSGALPIEQALDIAAQTARALGAAHEAGVVHRDVKPGNILVRPDGAVKVTDFGIARAVDAVPLTQTGTVVGTATYLSPEQAAGKPTMPASDLYSLGVVTYEMVAGLRPFTAENPVAVALAHLRDEPQPLPGEVPDAVRALVMRALEKDPADRHPDASAFAAEAEHAAAVSAGLLPPGPLPATTEVLRTTAEHVGDHTRTLRTTPPSVAGRPRAQRRRALWLAAAALLIGLLVVMAADAMSDDTKRSGALDPSAAASAPTTVETSAPTVASTSAAASSSPPAPTPSQVAIPANLIGMTYEKAAAALTAAQLKPVRRDAAHTSAPGTVWATDPKVGSLRDIGAAVTLVTSTGPARVVEQPAQGGGGGGGGDDDDEKGGGKKKRGEKDD